MKKRKSIIIFFIISYTITILTFSVGISAINSQKLKIKKGSVEYNRSIVFDVKENVENVKEINSEDIIAILEKNNVSTILKRYKDDGIAVETYLTINGEFYKEDMKNGEYFTKEDFKSNKNKAVFSNTFIGEKAIDLVKDNGEIETIKFTNAEISYEKEAKMTIPVAMFKRFKGGINFNDMGLQLIINGEKVELEKTIKEIKSYIETNNKNHTVSVYDYMTFDRDEEWRALLRTTILIIFVTLINSIGIAYLWIESRKKEIVLRKVVGALNFDVTKIFFLELFKIAIISMFTAILSQFIISFLTGGYVLDMNIKMSFINIIASFVITIGTTLITSIPFLIYLMKVQPVEMLREE